MFLVEYRALLKRLDPLCTRALEQAAGFAISRRHYEVGVEHLLLQLLEGQQGDVPTLFRSLNTSMTSLNRSLQNGVEQRQRGNTGRPVFSPLLVTWIQDAWLLGSVEYQASRVRSGHLFLVLLLQPERYEAAAYADLLGSLDRDTIRRKFDELTQGSIEVPVAAPAEATLGPGRPAGAPPSAPPEVAADSALGKFTYDLTGRARAGKIDPVLGRDREIRQLIDILGRRQKNNPIIVGEAGVGKTALVEGLALRIAHKDVPPALFDVEVRTLDMGLLQAGAGVKGEFEARLTAVIGEVKASPKPIILFIDEAHTMIGAGNNSGGSDAANLLKPALARGELRTIAATTWSEYKKFFEKDAALSRRFQLVKVEEPSAEAATDMLRGLCTRLAAGHGIHIRDDAVVAAVELSRRYIAGRLLPDKAVDLLDTCAARVKLGLATRPGELEQAVRAVEAIERERAALQQDDRLRGHSVEGDTSLVELNARLAEAEARREQLEERWRAEKAAAEAVLALRQQQALQTEQTPHTAPAAEHAPPPGVVLPAENLPAPVPTSAQLKEALAKLHAEQKEIPLVSVEVDPETVAAVVADWTGIPVGKMVRDDVAAVNAIEERLMRRIRGQDAAIAAIARRLRNSRAGLQDPRQPLGVFLLVGPSGTGKTETALSVAELLFGGERFMTTINMSEFQEKHTVSRLIGSPPGYVGYGEGGVLTEAVRQRPYSVVLLDEVEKADPEVLNLFYQVFDKGMLADGEGRVVDFRNTVIFMTSNLASDITMRLAAAGERAPTSDDLAKALRPALTRHFKPALLARMTVVPFFPITAEVLRQIVELKLGLLAARMHESHRVTLGFSTAVYDAIVARCEEADTGARNVDHIVREHLLPILASRILAHLAEGDLPDAMTVDLDPSGAFTVVTPPAVEVLAAAS
ncbi:MAG TPA: type VI secretion system ATPase TssH [Pseudomonadota bacterium]|nr:type VI secretion system ATPase TssH [Pseudomonadota bacterium]